jgi:hypothetical protein
MEKIRYERVCPICLKSIFYSHEESFLRVVKLNKPCIKCNNKRKNSCPPEKVELFKSMIEQGHFQKEITEKLNLSLGQYQYLVKKFHVISNKETSIKIVDKENQLAQCSECNKVYPLDEFHFVLKKNGYGFYRTYCDFCHYKKRNAHINSSIDLFLAVKYQKLRGECKKYNILFTISKEDFVKQYYNQNGVCFYTDLPMVWAFGQGKHRDNLSVDRIVPNLGYVKKNIVFCCNRINMAKNDLSLDEMKQWTPGWYERIKNFLEREECATQNTL